MIYNHRDSLPTLFGLFVTLVSADWFSNALNQCVVFFCAQNCLHYQINKHEMEGENIDSTILSFTVLQSILYCFMFSAISYAMFSSQAHLFLKNQLSVRQTEQMQDVLHEIDDGLIILEE